MNFPVFLTLMSPPLLGVVLLLSFCIYFLPTFLAKGNAVTGVFLVNLLFGWSVLGWIGALIWAVNSRNSRKAEERHEQLMNAVQQKKQAVVVPERPAFITPLVKNTVLGVLILAATFFTFQFINRPHTPSGPKSISPIVLKKHSDQFNSSTDSLVNAYLEIKNAFVNTDSVAAKKAALFFIDKLDAFSLDELNKDSTVLMTAQANIIDIKSNAVSLAAQPDIKEMRKDFSAVTEQFYPFLRVINYEGPTLYFANCPMAFGEDKPANWISNSAEIVNPYLGKNNPEYKATMLSCGEVKDSISVKK